MLPPVNMGFATGEFKVSKLPSGVKHTAEALAYVSLPFSQRRTAQGPGEARTTAASTFRSSIPAETERATYNTSCNLYM